MLQQMIPRLRDVTLTQVNLLHISYSYQKTVLSGIHYDLSGVHYAFSGILYSLSVIQTLLMPR